MTVRLLPPHAADCESVTPAEDGGFIVKPIQASRKYGVGYVEVLDDAGKRVSMTKLYVGDNSNVIATPSQKAPPKPPAAKPASQAAAEDSSAQATT